MFRRLGMRRGLRRADRRDLLGRVKRGRPHRRVQIDVGGVLVGLPDRRARGHRRPLAAFAVFGDKAADDVLLIGDAALSERVGNRPIQRDEGLPRQDVGKGLQTDRCDIVRHHVVRNAGAEDIERRGILPPVGRGLDARRGLRPRRHGGIGENQYRDDAGRPLQRSEHDPLSLTAFPHFP